MIRISDLSTDGEVRHPQTNFWDITPDVPAAALGEYIVNEMRTFFEVNPHLNVKNIRINLQFDVAV